MDLFNCSIRGVCDSDKDMGVVSRAFAEVGWRRGLGARKPRSGVRNQRHEAGCRHRRERGDAAREGGLDARGGRGARSAVVRHWEVPI